MLTKRIIPCLDVAGGRVVKGVNFVNLRDAGDAIELGKIYTQQGADELVFLDISATIEQRRTFAELVEKISAQLSIPFTVGGGIRSVEDVRRLLDAGADKISVNSAAVRRPQLIEELAQQFGCQCVVLAVDCRLTEGGWRVCLDGGRTLTELEPEAWVRQAVAAGAGEILLTSMEHDGLKKGFAIELTAQISRAVPVPVIASGGGGSKEDFYQVFESGLADAALAASIFHYGEISIPDLKEYLQGRGVAVRRIERDGSRPSQIGKTLLEVDHQG